jgi:exodeoxyribonuclease VII small subunit
MTHAKPKHPTFEQAFRRLEAIVESLERGETTLEESLTAFEEGMALVRACTEKLDEAEKRLERLIKTDDGTLETEDAE